jgi:hypothetical protein
MRRVSASSSMMRTAGTVVNERRRFGVMCDVRYPVLRLSASPSNVIASVYWG